VFDFSDQKILEDILDTFLVFQYRMHASYHREKEMNHSKGIERGIERDTARPP
jgi:hypothetical protein